MEFKAQTRTEQVLIVLKIIAWIAFFGFAVKAGANIISYVVSYFHPEGAQNLYMGSDLLELRIHNFFKYSVLVAAWVALLILKANVWYRVARIISLFKIESLFTLELTHKLEKISYLLFSISVLGYVGSTYAGWVGEMAERFQNDWNASEFLFMAGLMFVVSQIFRRGVEIQSENELTV
ncbi:DUF2975 domain-containing protein [Mariniphaga sp.]|uniref:DUF2975 domain-containing protein n=1 Tax=Mariniphaga sp. TaxID=1954475 RepID=UPI003563CA8E